MRAWAAPQNPANFYPRPPCGGRPLEGRIHTDRHTNFYPRPPCGGRHRLLTIQLTSLGISIHVPLAGDDQRFRDSSRVNGISIHVPLAGDDRVDRFPRGAVRDFYPRPPCGGRQHVQRNRLFVVAISIHVPLAGDDDGRIFFVGAEGEFLSTSPLRGTTLSLTRSAPPLNHFYPRPPCGGRLQVPLCKYIAMHFYPRPPCGGRLSRYRLV